MRSILNAQPGPRDLKQFASSITKGGGPPDGTAVEGGAKSGHPAAIDQGSQTLILG